MDEPGIRLLIADDHNLFRQGIINLFESEKDIFIVGEADTGESLLTKYSELKPDVVLADISMPVMSGIDALKKLIEMGESPKFLFLSMYDGDEYIYYCAKAGCMGLVSKKVMKGELLYAVRTVNDGKKYFGMNITEENVKEIIGNFEKKGVRGSSRNELITPREEEILKLISEGLTSNEIADRLYVSKRTIDTHRTHLMQKLNLKSLPELIKYSINFFMVDKSGKA
jgi:two-component system response regulator NreC